MLPSQQITPDWLLNVVRRRWWLPVIPFVIGLVAHDRLRGRSCPTSTGRRLSSSSRRHKCRWSRTARRQTLPLTDRLRMLEQEVMNRARLERIILDFDLYREERENGIMEDVVERMRKDISVTPPRGASRRNQGTSFSLSYTTTNARTAHRVAERLTSLFIDENIRQRETVAEGTDQFLSAEVTTARQRLEETERKLENYKRQYGGELPQLLQTNLTVLHNAQTQIQSLTESIERDRAEIAGLQRSLSDLTDGAVSADGGDGAIDLPAAVATPYDEALVKARAELDGLLLRLTPDHPNVLRQRRIVEELEDRANAAQLARPLSPSSPVAASAGASAADRSRRNQVLEARKRIAQIEAQIAAKTREIETRRREAASYQARVESAPAREAELISLTRDYQTLMARYNQLLSRSEDAKVAANMERRQVSEQFRLVDPPRVPERPIGPDRTRMTMMGAAGGFGLGVVLIALLEYRDRSFRTDAEIIANLALPVVAVIPAMLTPAERRRRWRRRWLVSATGVVTLMLGTLAAVWRYGL
jgi:polysaccharide chain length determinant protein (PEP-CTERM system associated)